MGTRKNNKKSNKRFRKTRSKKQRGSGNNCSRPGSCIDDRNNIEGDDPNTINEYLELAIREEMPVKVQEYLDKGADPNIIIVDEQQPEGIIPVNRPFIDEYLPGPHRAPAIIYVVRSFQVPDEHTEILRILLENGADVNATDNVGETALRRASRSGHTKIVGILLDNKADMNAKNNLGYTALFLASYSGRKEIVAMLLEKGAEANTKDNVGNTALHWASRNGHAEIVELLNLHIKRQYVLHIERLQMKDRQNSNEVFARKPVQRDYGRPRTPTDVARYTGDFLFPINYKKRKGGKRKTRKNKRK